MTVNAGPGGQFSDGYRLAGLGEFGQCLVCALHGLLASVFGVLDEVASGSRLCGEVVSSGREGDQGISCTTSVGSLSVRRPM